MSDAVSRYAGHCSLLQHRSLCRSTIVDPVEVLARLVPKLEVYFDRSLMFGSDLCPGALRVITCLNNSVPLPISCFDMIKALFAAGRAVSAQINMIYIYMYLQSCVLGSLSIQNGAQRSTKYARRLSGTAQQAGSMVSSIGSVRCAVYIICGACRSPVARGTSLYTDLYHRVEVLLCETFQPRS